MSGVDGFDAADQDHDDHVVGALKGLPPVGGGLDAGREVALAQDALSDASGVVQALGVDVHEGEGGLSQLGEGKDVGHQPLREREGSRHR